MTAEAASILASDRPPAQANAVEVTDVVLAAAIARGATALWLEPEAGKHGRDAHRVSIERGRREVAATILEGGLGDAVIARLALLCELDLLERGAHTGRCTMRLEATVVTVWVTIRSAANGLRAEVRVVKDEVGDVASVTSVLPDVLGAQTAVGPYRVLEVLGAGGMGIVYRVEHTLLAKQLAMKVLRRELLTVDPDSVRRFMREGRAAARIRADGIVTVTDYGSLADGRPYLVMELMHGRSLGEMLEAEGALPVRQAVYLARCAARALRAAHEAGVIHRDLTPTNIFLDAVDGEERVKLLDFGAAHSADPNTVEVPDGPPGIVLGTPYYMPPEQARGLETDARSDLYALGIILFEMICGRVPFDAPTIREIVAHQVKTPAPVPVSPHEALPPDLERVVARLLRKAPDERFQTAAELARELERIERSIDRKGWRKWLPA